MAKKALKDIEPYTPVEFDAEMQRHIGGGKVGMFMRTETYGEQAYTHAMVYRNNTLQDVRFPVYRADKQIHVLSGAMAETIKTKYLQMAKDGEVKALDYVSPTIGADPEIFVEHGDGTLFPADEFLRSKKENKDTFWDGFQAEFTTQHRYCLQEFHEQVRAGLYRVLHAARTKDSKARLSSKSVVKIPYDLMQSSPVERVRFGCSPSLNVYGDSPELPAEPGKVPYRFAGGHMHVGLAVTDAQAERIVKACDGVLGVAGVGLFAGMDDPIRRKAYGRAGEYRRPEYGIEYRVMSNAHLCHPGISHLVFETFRVAIMFGLSGLYKHIWQAKEDQVREIINNCDVDAARKLLRENEKVLRWLYKARGWDAQGPEVNGLVAAFQVGARELVDVENIERNWHLTDGKWMFNSSGENCYWGSLCHNLKVTKVVHSVKG